MIGKLVKGMAVGTLVGAAAMMAVNIYDPTLGGKLLRKGKGMLRMARRKVRRLSMI